MTGVLVNGEMGTQRQVHRGRMWPEEKAEIGVACLLSQETQDGRLPPEAGRASWVDLLW